MRLPPWLLFLLHCISACSVSWACAFAKASPCLIDPTESSTVCWKMFVLNSLFFVWLPKYFHLSFFLFLWTDFQKNCRYKTTDGRGDGFAMSPGPSEIPLATSLQSPLVYFPLQNYMVLGNHHSVFHYYQGEVLAAGALSKRSKCIKYFGMDVWKLISF